LKDEQKCKAIIDSLEQQKKLKLDEVKQLKSINR